MSDNNSHTGKFLVIVNIRDRNVMGAIAPILRVFDDLTSASDYYDMVENTESHRLDSIYLIEGTLWRTKVFSGMGSVLRDEDFVNSQTIS